MVDLVVWIVVAAVILFIIYYINKIAVLENRIQNAWSQIDVQLKKRADLVPNLVEIVKGYMKHEKNLLTEVTKARTAAMGAESLKDKAKADNMLSNTLKTIFAVSENYPALRATENFQMLQEELSGIENKIAYARQAYNDAVLEYDNTISTIPGVLFANTMGKKAIPYFETEEKERKNVKVQF